MKRIKKISIAVCMLTTLMVIFSACSKQEDKIVGVWCMTSGTDCYPIESGDVLTMRPDKTFSLATCENTIKGTYYIYDNSISLKGSNSANIHYSSDAIITDFSGEFSIVRLEKDEMILSGGITYNYYFDGHYYYNETSSGDLVCEK